MLIRYYNNSVANLWATLNKVADLLPGIISNASYDKSALYLGDTLTITKSEATNYDSYSYTFTVGGVDRRSDLVDNGSTFTFDTTGETGGVDVSFRDTFTNDRGTTSSDYIVVSLVDADVLRTVSGGGSESFEYESDGVPISIALGDKFTGGTPPYTYAITEADPMGNITLGVDAVDINSENGYSTAIQVTAYDSSEIQQSVDLDILVTVLYPEIVYDGMAPQKIYAIANETVLSYDFGQHYSGGSGSFTHSADSKPAGVTYDADGILGGTPVDLFAPRLGVDWEAGYNSDRTIYVNFFDTYTVPVGYTVYFDLVQDPSLPLQDGTQLNPGETFTGSYEWPVGTTLGFRMILRRDSDGANMVDDRVTITIEDTGSGSSGGAGFTSSDLGTGTSGLSATDLGADEFVGMNIYNDSRRLTVFDAGRARGLGYASILWRGQCSDNGSSTAGGIVQVNTWNGSEWVWSDVATVQSDGSWSGRVQHWERAGIYKPELRFKDGDGSVSTLNNMYGVGMLRFEHGQSNKYHWSHQDDQGSFSKPAVENGECLWVAFSPTDLGNTKPMPSDWGRVYRIDGSGLGWNTDILSGDPAGDSGSLYGLPSAWRLIANSINRNFGGVPVVVCPMDIAGQGWDHMVKEENAYFPEDKERHISMVLTDEDRGQAFGFGAFQFSSGTGAEFADPNVLGASLTGYDRDGNKLSKPEYVVRYNRHWEPTYKIVWSANEVVDFSIGSIVLQSNSWVFDDDTISFENGLLEIQSNDNYPQNPFNSHSPEQGWYKGYVNGENDGVDDTNHPARDTLYGGPTAGVSFFNGSLAAAGFYPGGNLKLDVIEKHPNGDSTKVRIGFSTGYATTMHLGMNRPRLDGRPDVRGFRMNGSLVDAMIEDDDGNPAKRGWVVIRKSGGITDSDIRSIDYAQDWQSASGSGDDVASGWTVGHRLAYGFGVDGFTYASHRIRHSDLFTNFENYAPDFSKIENSRNYSYPPAVVSSTPGGGSDGGGSDGGSDDGGSGGTPSTDLQADLEALETNPNIGCPATISGPKVFGVDDLPTGASYSGTRIDITGDNVELAGWSGPGYALKVKANGARIRECEFDERTPDELGSGEWQQIEIEHYADDCIIEDTSVIGAGQPKPKSQCGIQSRADGALADGSFRAPRGLILRRNRLSNQQEDAMRINGEFLIEYNNFGRHLNIPVGTEKWSSSVNYKTGDWVMFNGYLYRATADNYNSAPAGSKDDNAYWDNLDPHSDTINIRSISHESYIQYNRLETDISNAIGLNGSIWLAPNTNKDWPMNGGLHVIGNLILPRDTGQYAPSIRTKITGQDFDNFYFRHNFVGVNELSGSYWSDLDNVTNNWDTMVDAVTGEPIPAPAGADTTSTPAPTPIFP